MKDDAEGRSWNCQEQLELPRTVGTNGKANTEGRTLNFHEQPKMLGTTRTTRKAGIDNKRGDTKIDGVSQSCVGSTEILPSEVR